MQQQQLINTTAQQQAVAPKPLFGQPQTTPQQQQQQQPTQMINTQVNVNVAAPAPNAQAMGANVPASQDPSEISSQSLLSKIQVAITSGKDQEISNILNDKKIADRLEKGLMHYKTINNGDYNRLEQTVNALQLKFAKKEPISDNMKEMVLRPFALECGLEAQTAFQVLDNYFSVQYRQLYHFESVNKRIIEFQNQIQNQQMQMQGAYAMQQNQRQQQYTTYHDELTKLAKQSLTDVKAFYLKERYSLLLCITSLFGLMARQQGSVPTLIRDKLVKKELPLNLAKSLLRCQRSESNEFQRFSETDNSQASIERLTFAVQEEQIELLKLLFMVYFKEPDQSSFKPDMVNLTVQYLQQSCQIDHLTDHNMKHLPKFTANQSTIAGLTQLVCFAMLQLQSQVKPAGNHRAVISKQQSQHAWQLLMNVDNLSQATGTLVLAVCQDAIEARQKGDESVKSMIDCLSKNSQYLVTMTELLGSQVFQNDGLQAMNDAFYLVIYGWLTKAYRFYSEMQMRDEIEHVQSLTLSVFGNPSIVHMIWKDINKTGSIKDVGSSIEIFSDYLKNPTLNVDKFLTLCLVLAGKKQEQRGTSVMEMLVNSVIKDDQADSNLLAELIAFLSGQMVPMEAQRLDNDEFSMVSSLLTLFAKVIKQDPTQYAFLNNQYMQVAEMAHDGHLGMIFEKSTNINRQRRNNNNMHYDQGYQFTIEAGSHPFLSLMVRALHNLTPIAFTYSRPVICHLMDALTAIYDHDELMLRAEIIFLLQSYDNLEIGGSQIVQYFSGTVLDQENQLMNFKATQSYLRFITKVFKRPYPQECLDPEGVIQMEQSIIFSSLQQVYQQLMLEYFNISFADAASIGNLTARLLKLTRVLLDHFLEIPQSQKAPMCESMPRFNFLLELISNIVNQFQVEQICLRALELVSVEERASSNQVVTRYENKILNDAIQSRYGSSSQLKKLGKMQSEAILLLNSLLKLALVDDIPSNIYERGTSVQASDWNSKRCSYIRNLQCVQTFRSQVLDPSNSLHSASGAQSSQGSNQSLSLQSLVSHYINPNSKINNYVLRKGALDHLTLTCQLWKNSLIESVRPDLFQLLQGLCFGSTSQLESLFFSQLEFCFSSERALSLVQCLAYLDLLIVSAQSQPRFLEMLLKKADSGKKQALDRLCGAILKTLNDRRADGNILQEQQRLHIKFKFTTLLSLLAKKRLCIDFVNFKDGAFLKSVMENVIEEECLKRLIQGAEKVQLNGNCLPPVIDIDENAESLKAKSNLIKRRVSNQCHAKIALCQFMQLLVSEYSRDPSMPWVRDLITKVFCNAKYKTLSLSEAQISPDVHSLMSQIRNLNEVLQMSEERDLHLQKKFHDLVIGSQLASVQEQSENPLYSREGAVFMKGNMCIDLFKVLEKRSLASFTVGVGAELVEMNKSGQGRLGSQLYVSTKELEYALRQEFYKNQHLIGQAVQICSEFNLALSVMLCDHFVLKAKQDFMISVGKIALRDAQSISKAEQLVPMSFLPLINRDANSSMNTDAFKRDSSELTKVLIKQAQLVQSQILQRKRSLQIHEELQHQQTQGQIALPQNHFLTKLDQDLLSMLVFTLSVISSQVSASRGSLQVDIKQDLQQLVQSDILTKVNSIIDIDSCHLDGTMIANEVSGFGISHKAANAIQSSEKHRYEIFIELVTQCFQLSIRLKEDEMPRKTFEKASQMEQQRLDNVYIKVLSTVLEGMRRNLSFLKGLKVFVQAVQLTDSHLKSGFSQLMKKQGDTPMKVILGKLMEKDVTPDEVATILQLLINYASTATGAIHLNKCNILETLFKSNIMQRLNDQELYISKQQKNNAGGSSFAQIRNPSHIHWCQLLLLMRTLNETLLENPQVEHQQYFIDLVKQIHHFKQRIPKVLHIGMSMDVQSSGQPIDQLGNRSILSMALLEEIELICAVLQQLFEHADEWSELDPSTYIELKDYTIFAVPKLLQNCVSSAVVPASVTEQHLANVTAQDIDGNQTNLLVGNLAQSQSADSNITAFQLKIEVSLQKTFLNLTGSVLNCLLLSKKLVEQGKLSRHAGKDLIDTWSLNGGVDNHSFSQRAPSQTNMHQTSRYQTGPASSSSSVFTEQWLNNAQAQGTSIVALAFEVFRSCQQRMVDRYALLRNLFDKKQVQGLYSYMQNVFQHDEWVQQEYCGGLNAHMLADFDGIEDVLSLTETSIQVSCQVSAMLLEKVRANGNKDGRFGYDERQVQSEEQQVVFMAKDLLSFLKQADRECKQSGLVAQQQPSSDNVFSNQNEASSSNIQSNMNNQNSNKELCHLDGAYLDKLVKFVDLVKQEPHAPGAAYATYHQRSNYH